MKNLRLFFSLFILSVCVCVSCDMYKNMEQYNEETVYPGKFDTLFFSYGFERVEIDLAKAGRIPANKMNLGKAVKTVYEYDGQVFELDSLYSWINITGLDRKKMYRVKIYTLDNFGNKSVEKTCSFIPYTAIDMETMDVPKPRVMMTLDGAAIIDWPAGLDSPIANFVEFYYNYKDKSGTIFKDTLRKGDKLRIDMQNMNIYTPNEVNIMYRLIPVIADSVKFVDTLSFEQRLSVSVPSESTPFYPSESAALRANGIEFTYGEALKVTKLVLPLHISTLSDLTYFPNLKELDLTGKGLENILPEIVLDGNNVSRIVRGSNYYPYMQRIEYTDKFPIRQRIDAVDRLLEMLESGAIEKVTYIQNSLTLDAQLAPYIASGVVQYVDDSWYDEVLPLDHRLIVDGTPSAPVLACNISYPLSPEDVPQPDMIEHPDEVYMIRYTGRSATFTFMLPSMYRYDLEKYRYLKFSVFLKGGEAALGPAVNGNYGACRIVWPRISYAFWNADYPNAIFSPANMDFRWEPGREQLIQPEKVNNEWVAFTVDMEQANLTLLSRNHTTPAGYTGTGHTHFRNICITLGGDWTPNPAGNGTFVDPEPSNPIVYYFTNFRLSRTP